MSNGEYGSGKITEIHRAFGIGVIAPNAGGGNVLFTPSVVHGGELAFQGLRRGREVIFRRYPGRIAGMEFADDVIPE
jgi:hypothetical protein